MFWTEVEMRSANTIGAQSQWYRIIHWLFVRNVDRQPEDVRQELVPTFRDQFDTPPANWRQQGRDGKPLASWYGGEYAPACMNNPNWRAYERAMVREQLETGHDGIFFDNPTVHPQGCYCPHCITKFARFLEREKVNVAAPLTDGTNSDSEILALATGKTLD